MPSRRGSGVGPPGPRPDRGLVYRYNERKTVQRNQSVRMLAHLIDLGVDAAVPGTAAKKMVLQEAGAGLPGNGPVSVDQLEQARMAAREAG